MDTKKLGLLLETVNCGSMKRAAENLNYTQSGLVYMLNSLEQEIGFPVLNRTFRGVTLTPQGEVLLPYIRDLVESANAMESAIADLTASRQQQLCVGAYPAIARNWLPEISKQFIEQYPEVNMKIIIGIEELPAMLEAGEIDLAICEKGIAGNNRWTPVTGDELYVALPAEKSAFQANVPVSLDVLSDYPVLMTSHNPRSAGIPELTKWVSSSGGIRKLEIKAPDGYVQLSMVAEGLGIAFLSRLYSYDCPLSVQMHPLDPPIYREIGCITAASAPSSPMTDVFISFLQNYFSE